MLSPKRFFRILQNMVVFDSFYLPYRLYCDKPHLINIEAGNILYVKTDEEFSTEDDESVPTFLKGTKIPKEKFKNSQLYGVFITEKIRDTIYKEKEGYDESLHLLGVLMFNYYKWINFTLPIGFIIAQHPPKLNLKNTPFKFVDCVFKDSHESVDWYYNKYSTYNDRKLIDSFNIILSKSHDKHREFSLMAFYRIFKERFPKNPISIDENGNFLIEGKILYSVTLNNLIHFQEN